MGIKKVQRQFNFLRFFFGKSFFCLFLGLMCFNRHKWFSWACSILFFISAFFYLMLGFTFIKDEKNRFNSTSIGGSTNNSKEVKDVEIKQNNQFPPTFKL